MLDIYIQILISALTVLIGLLGMVLILKRYANSDRFIDIFEDLLEEVAQNEPLQKQIYSIGGLIGSGVRAGVGIGKKGGKMSVQDLIVDIAGQYFRNKLGNAGNSQTPSNQGSKDEKTFKL